MTILEIFVLCHVHAIAEPFTPDSPAYRRAIDKFMYLGLIKSDANPSGFRTTVNGHNLVERLKEVNP